jgi:hypothetical protein
VKGALLGCCHQQGYGHPRAAFQRTVDSTSRVMVLLSFKDDNLAVKGGPNLGPRQRPYIFRGFRCPLSRGATWRPYRSGWHSVSGLTPAFPHSSRTVPGRVGGTVPGYDSQAVSEGRAWRGFTF